MSRFIMALVQPAFECTANRFVDYLCRRGVLSGTPTVLAGALAIAVTVNPIAAEAGGDAAAGKEKAVTCTACHGADGISTAPNFPILAGQYESYLAQALKSYRDGSRQNAIMAGFATQLSDEDIADLSAWYASQTGPLQTAPRP